MNFNTFNLLVRRVNRGNNVHVVSSDLDTMEELLQDKLCSFGVLVFRSYTDNNVASVLACLPITDASSPTIVMEI